MASAEYKKTCIQCGKEFMTKREAQKYCSSDCSHAARKTGRTQVTKICPHCGASFSTINKQQIFCSVRCNSQYHGKQREKEYFCEYCGKPRHSDHPNRNRFCSKECALNAKRMETQTRKEEEKKQQIIERTRLCDNCGKTFVASSKSNHFCSYDCQYEHALKMSHDKNLAAFKPEERTCPFCGAGFKTTFQGTQSQIYCSQECRKQAEHCKYNEKRKEQMQKAFVEPVGLKSTYRRYNGVCGICGLPVPARSDPGNIWAATVDHIVPISKGGLHMKSNCQLAHRICNSMKLDTVGQFSVNWTAKLASEAERWGEALIDLREQIGTA